MSIAQYNGGIIVAMAGKDCVGIAADTKIGKKFLMQATNFQKVFQVQNNILLGISGLATDIATLQHVFISHAQIQYKIKLYNLKQGRQMKPTVFANLVGYSLFMRRFGSYFIEPIVIGIENEKPFICGFDSIGAKSINEVFCCAGTGAEQLLTLCEAGYREGMQVDQLGFKLQQILISAMDRDILSGWGGVMHILTTQNGIISKNMKNTPMT